MGLAAWAAISECVPASLTTAPDNESRFQSIPYSLYQDIPKSLAGLKSFLGTTITHSRQPRCGENAVRKRDPKNECGKQITAMDLRLTAVSSRVVAAIRRTKSAAARRYGALDIRMTLLRICSVEGYSIGRSGRRDAIAERSSTLSEAWALISR